MRKLSMMVMTLALAGCMGGLDVVIAQNDPVAAAKTFFIIGGQDEAKAGRSSRLVGDFVYGRLDATVARGLTERGYDRVLDAQRADLVVRYAVFAREWTTMKAIPPPPLSQPPPGWDRVYDGAYNASYYDVKVQDHREGSMVVDVVDTATGKLAYRFYVEGGLSGSPKDNFARVEDAVAEGFRKFKSQR